tara:strand:- start:1641 stop:2264 length:624 start_codon:yes stop_codon:yes gene_type:complete
MSIDASKVIGQTQRNWDYDSKISEEEMKYLIDISLNAPVKENTNVYKMFVSTNTEFNKMIQEWAYSTEETKYKAQKTKDRNAQVAAPLLMMYVVEDFSDTNVGVPDACFSVGIAAGATALASAEIGYQTGFCSCLHIPGLVEHMANRFPGNFLEKFWKNSEIQQILCLGIGKKNPNANNRSQIMKDGKVQFTTGIKSRTKPSVLIYK